MSSSNSFGPEILVNLVQLYVYVWVALTNRSGFELPSPVIIHVFNSDMYFSEVTERVWSGVLGPHCQGDGLVRFPVD